MLCEYHYRIGEKSYGWFQADTKDLKSLLGNEVSKKIDNMIVKTAEGRLIVGYRKYGKFKWSGGGPRKPKQLKLPLEIPYE